MWQTTLTWQNAQARAKLLAKVRAFFVDKNVVEVETPALSVSTVTDVYLEAFVCQYNFLSDTSIDSANNLYLQTSPEFHMKRLLASGYGAIFQICKAFRHEDSGHHHNPEFTLLEWYRPGFDHLELMDEVDELLQTILATEAAQRRTYQNIFIEKLSLDPLTCGFSDLYDIIVSHGKGSAWLKQSNDKDVLLQFIFSEIIEPTIGLDKPCFIYDFPRSQASLAKISPDDERVAQRFECYYQGIELANGFNELTDSKEQLDRFEQDNKKRVQLGLPQIKIDDNFISALTFGLPECSGVALGLDRLIMLAEKLSSITQVISFPVERA